ncbi:molybdopterin-dependent oxidoreductase [Pseudonocardia sp. NPDC046786]|uniref:molybdopterin-dependent oxidoreductase n=1 Tax=Pseudonocardia sp. NPDC046786 TaxID=3155471 RepID=UPI0033CE3940
MTRGSTSHWGAFTAEVSGDDLVAVLPHPADPAPSPLLDNLRGASRHPARVLRPAVRRGWLEHGPGPADRGAGEEFVEVGWDTALRLVADEITRVRERHGHPAVFAGSYGWASAGVFHRAPDRVHRLHALLGGFTGSRDSYSTAASRVVFPHLVGDVGELFGRAASWDDVAEHTDLVVAFGGLPDKNLHVINGGVTGHLARGGPERAVAAGTGIVSISPVHDGGPGTWWPIVPGTDVALIRALIHTLFTEGLADTAFLQRCTDGADRLRADILDRGHDAGWAAGPTGLAADDIRALARRMAAGRTLVTVTWSLQRVPHGEHTMWSALALAAVLGQIGLPGGGLGHGHGSMGNAGSGLGPSGFGGVPAPVNPVADFIPCARIADLLLGPGTTFDYDGGRHTYPDVRLVHWAGGNPFHHHQDLHRLRRAFGRPDTVVVHEQFWTPTARHADIVLPATLTTEREDIGAGRSDSHLVAMHRLQAPAGQARDDHEICAGLAGLLGIGEAYTGGRTPREWLRHLYDGWATGREPRPPSFDDFWEAGDLALPRPRRPPAFARFRGDPQAHPLRTPSGRIQLVSPTIAAAGLADCPGVPSWLEPPEWLGAPAAARFPLHLIADQPAGRLHSQLDFGPASVAGKVAGREALRIHPDDAAARGVSDGDVLLVHNDRGACLAGARLSGAVRRGVVQLPTGAWFDPAEELRDDAGRPVCVHGNPNVLTADRPTSGLAQGCTGQHALVEVTRFDGEPPPVRAFRPPPLVAGTDHR